MPFRNERKSNHSNHMIHTPAGRSRHVRDSWERCARSPSRDSFSWVIVFFFGKTRAWSPLVRMKISSHASESAGGPTACIHNVFLANIGRRARCIGVVACNFTTRMVCFSWPFTTLASTFFSYSSTSFLFHHDSTCPRWSYFRNL